MVVTRRFKRKKMFLILSVSFYRERREYIYIYICVHDFQFSANSKEGGATHGVTRERFGEKGETI